MYKKKTLEESRRRFTKIAEYGFLLTNSEKTLITAVVDIIDSHLQSLAQLDEANDDITHLQEQLLLSDEIIDYWANR